MSVLTVETVDVHKGETRVGTLSRTPRGAELRYADEHVARASGDRHAAIAFAMPVRTAPYDVAGVNLHPFFAGLLPEGLRLRALVRAVKTSEDDLFSLLVAAGRDTVGDVSVTRPGEAPRDEAVVLDSAALDTTSFRELLEQSLRFDGEGGNHAAVAGVQPKVSAAMISFPVRTRSARRACLLKLAPVEYPRLIENEAFFMAAAAHAGVDTARVGVVHDVDGEAGLLVDRFDRLTRDDGSIARIHQEDACQLLDRYPADKYRVTLRDVASALDVCSAPIVERLRLLRLVAFSYAIGGGDLHAKNVSVCTRDGLVALSPAYDIVSTLPYGDDRMALSMDGRDTRFAARDFIAFGERVGVRAIATRRMLSDLVRRVGPWSDRVDEIGLAPKPTRHLSRTMTSRLLALDPSGA